MHRVPDAVRIHRMYRLSEIIMRQEKEECEMIRRGTRLRNQGSMIIEVTLIMPVILMLMVLFLTLLLSVLRQAEVHSALMTEYIMYENSGAAEWEGKDTAFEGSADVVGDRRIYSGEAEITLIRGYGISSVEQQVVRISDIEEKLRRWQMLGDLGSE